MFAIRQDDAVLEGSWAVLAAVLERSWGQVGRSWGQVGRSWGQDSRSWSGLGGS